MSDYFLEASSKKREVVIMYQEKIEYLKKELKNTYEEYMEKKSNRTTILDVANFFNIPIDTLRLNDYVINCINFSNPSIEITDKRNAILYKAIYTGDADLLHYNGDFQFNSVISTSAMRKEEKLYYIGCQTPLITKMTFFNGEYELVFERESANSVGIFSNNNGMKMTIKYLQNVIYRGKKVKQLLLNKSYTIEEKEGSCSEILNQVYTYGMHHFIKRGNSQDKYTYIKNNNIIYGINELEQKNFLSYLRGICFEDTNIPIRNYLPLSMSEKDWPLLKVPNVVSAMLFRFGTEDHVHHSLQIYKDKSNISIMYHSKEYGDDEDVIHEEKYSLPNLIEGTISSEEIQNILILLKIKLENDIVLSIISAELSIFKEKIDNKRAIIQQEIDPLAPNLFINKSFDEISFLIGANQETYFNLIKKQFEAISFANEISQKSQTKVLEKKTNNLKL